MSTKKQPKQFQQLTGERTMLQATYDRLREHYDAGHIYVSVNEEHREHITAQLPDISEDRVIYETALRDTSSAVALICAVIGAHHPDATVSVFPSDHVIGNPEELLSGLIVAENFISTNPSYILTFGISPSRPEVGYGYIERGVELVAAGDDSTHTVYRSKRFVEKPDRETAQSYLDARTYYWNAGMFVFDCAQMIERYREFVPDTYNRLLAIKKAVGTGTFEEVLREQYSEMDKISVDYAIMENVKDIALIPLDLNWSDVGTWVSLKETLVASHEHLSRGPHIDFHSQNIAVYADVKPVVTVGLKDMIIIDTPQATLVCSHEEASNLSKYIKELQDGDYDHLL